MPSLQTLLDVETEVENVLGNYLRTTLGLSNVAQGDSASDLTTPRVDCYAVLIEQGMHQYQIPAGTYAGRHLYDQNRIRASLNLVYSPETTTSSTVATAGTLRGTMRKMLTDYEALKTGFNVNGYLILAPDTLRIIDGDRVIDDQRKEETISATIEAVFFFNPAALASPT